MSLSATSFVVNASPAAPAMGVVCAASARLRDIVVSPVVAGVGAVGLMGLMGLMGVVGMSRVVGVSPRRLPGKCSRCRRHCRRHCRRPWLRHAADRRRNIFLRPFFAAPVRA